MVKMSVANIRNYKLDRLILNRNSECQQKRITSLEVIGGGALVGLVNSLVLGIIFGPFAAACTFILCAIGSATLADIIAKRQENINIEYIEKNLTERNFVASNSGQGIREQIASDIKTADEVIASIS